MASEASKQAVVEALATTLLVTLSTDLTRTPPHRAVRDFTAKVAVCWSPDEGPDVDLAVLSELAHFDAEGYLPEVGGLLAKTLRIPVGRGDFVTADLAAPTCWDELASIGPDVRVIGDALLGEAFDLDELQADYDLEHQRALIVNHVEIDPTWRGAGYGLLATELVVDALGVEADVAALFPMQPGLSDLQERSAARQALSKYWARIGFVDFNGIMVRDLTGD